MGALAWCAGLYIAESNGGRLVKIIGLFGKDIYKRFVNFEISKKC